MTDLERQLSELASSGYLPPARDVSDRVRERIEREPRRAPRRRFASRASRTLIPALGLPLLVAATAVAATPALRHRIERLLGLRGVEIHRATRLPSVPRQQTLHLGKPIKLEAAGRAVGFHVLVPTLGALGKPDAVYVARGFPTPGGQVTLAYGSRPGFPRRRLTSVALLLSEFRARSLPYMDKTAAGATNVVPVRIDGGRGFWLAGAPHVQVYRGKDGTIRPDTLRLAGNTLVWERGPLTLRLEGAGSMRQALAVARSLR
jgi:hypothetical protein